MSVVEVPSPSSKVTEMKPDSSDPEKVD